MKKKNTHQIKLLSFKDILTITKQKGVKKYNKLTTHIFAPVKAYLIQETQLIYKININIDSPSTTNGLPFFSTHDFEHLITVEFCYFEVHRTVAKF